MKNSNELIQQYFELAPRSDSDAYFAQFAADAVVEDEGKLRHGVEEIRAWRSEVPMVSYAVQEIRPTQEGQVAVVDIAGDFPGSPVQLTFGFVFTDDGHIAALTIRP
jgi:hypothetical protein